MCACVHVCESAFVHWIMCGNVSWEEESPRERKEHALPAILNSNIYNNPSTHVSHNNRSITPPPCPSFSPPFTTTFTHFGKGIHICPIHDKQLTFRNASINRCIVQGCPIVLSGDETAHAKKSGRVNVSARVCACVCVFVILTTLMTCHSSLVRLTLSALCQNIGSPL